MTTIQPKISPVVWKTGTVSLLALYCLLPFAVLGQIVEAPHNPITQSVPAGLVYHPEKNVVIPAHLHFSADWKEAFGQSLHKEPITLKGIIRRDDNKMGASATGGLVYTGSDDVFAYAHYGRTGKLIWRTSPGPIANNMMATRWSLANFNIFRRASSPSIWTN